MGCHRFFSHREMENFTPDVPEQEQNFPLAWSKKKISLTFLRP
jgi:hypothetical protein